MKAQIVNPNYGYSSNNYGGVVTFSAMLEIVTDNYNPTATPPTGSIMYSQGISTQINVLQKSPGWYVGQVLPDLIAKATGIINSTIANIRAVFTETAQASIEAVLSDVVTKVTAALPVLPTDK